MFKLCGCSIYLSSYKYLTVKLLWGDDTKVLSAEYSLPINILALISPAFHWFILCVCVCAYMWVCCFQGSILMPNIRLSDICNQWSYWIYKVSLPHMKLAIFLWWEAARTQSHMAAGSHFLLFNIFGDQIWTGKKDTTVNIYSLTQKKGTEQMNALISII